MKKDRAFDPLSITTRSRLVTRGDCHTRDTYNESRNRKKKKKEERRLFADHRSVLGPPGQGRNETTGAYKQPGHTTATCLHVRQSIVQGWSAAG